MIVKTTEDLNVLVDRVEAAQKKFAEFKQDMVDLIFRHAAQAANENRIALARMAAEESGMGIFEDKNCRTFRRYCRYCTDNEPHFYGNF